MEGAFVHAAVAVPASAPQPYLLEAPCTWPQVCPRAPAAHPWCALHYHHRLQPDRRSE